MSEAGQTKIYEMVTERIIAALETGTVPWHQPWAGSGGLPRSMSTGKVYRGANVLVLGFAALDRGYTSPFWGTYAHIQKLGGQVRQGEEHEIATFWKSYPKDVENANGETETRTFRTLRYYRVYNAEQADGLPAKFYPKPEERTTVEIHQGAQELVDSYLARTGLKVRHGGSKANYNLHNLISVPDRDDFETAEDYYDCLYHECTHSTGHSSRLNRPGIENFDHFGSGQYAKEELVAAIGAAMLSAVTGIDAPHVQTNTAAYVANWLTALRKDPKLVVQAAAQAQRAADCIQGIEWDDSK